MTTLDDAIKAKVLRQVEFYFSDSNLPKDKFLKERMDPEGYVKLNIIVAFQRMRDFLKHNSSDPATVPAEAIATVADILSSSTTLEVDETKTLVKRKTPLRDEVEIARAVDARSLYARPFPVDANIDAITDFFSGVAAVNSVRMRRHARSKMFKGSVFVEFATAEDADKVLAMTSLEFAGAPLRLQKKVDHVEAIKAARKNRAAGGRHDGDLSDDSNAGQGLSDGAGGVLDGTGVVSSPPSGGRFQGGPDQVRRQQQQQQPRQFQDKRPNKRKQDEELEYDEGDLGDAPSSKRPKPEAAANGAAEDGDDEMGAGYEGEEEPAEPTFTPGCVLSFTLEAELPELTGPRVIVDVFGGRDKVKFVELNDDRKTGYLRFTTPELAAAALTDYEAREGDARTIAGIKGSMKKVEGEEESHYYKRAAKAAAARDARHRGGRGGRGRGGRGGFRGGRGRGGFRGGRGGRGGRH